MSESPKSPGEATPSNASPVIVPVRESATSSKEAARAADSVSASAWPFAKLPMQFGRYQVHRELGRGQMGAVYLAEDTQLERLVALKVAQISSSGSAKVLKRMEFEAKSAAKVDHPSICKIYDSGEIDGIRFIAMQYVEGEDLKKFLKREGRKRDPNEAVQLVLKILRALEAAHAQGVIHRDLKPENIMLNSANDPVIMDFGLARNTIASSNAGLTQGMIVGTAAYMSPEQAVGRAEKIDHRSDLYAVGVLLFELLTGEWPFTGSAFEVIGKKCNHEPPSPLSLNPQLQPQLVAVCSQLIAKQKSDRFTTCAEVIAALEAIQPEPATISRLTTSSPKLQRPSADQTVVVAGSSASKTVPVKDDGSRKSTTDVLAPMAKLWDNWPSFLTRTVCGVAAAGLLALAIVFCFPPSHEIVQSEIDDPPAIVETHIAAASTDAPEATSDVYSSASFLADLSPVWKTHLGNYFSTDGTIQGQKFLVNGVQSPNGIFLHPPDQGFSEIVYLLDPNIEKFQASVVIPNPGSAAAVGSALTFEVLGDDKSLWTSKPIQEFDRAQHCDVNLQNLKVLTLRVHCPGSANFARAVWVEPKLISLVSAKSTESQLLPEGPDRAAAQWVLSLGGTIGIRAGRRELEIKAGGTLPDGDFVLERIDLRDKQIRSAGLAHLEGLGNLHKLVLMNCPVGNTGLAHLQYLTGLTELILWNAGISDAGLVFLKNLSQLRHIELFNNRDVTDAGLSHLASLTKLQHLDLNATRVTNDGMTAIQPLTKLVHLNLMNTEINHDGLSHLAGFSKLKSLHLANSRADDPGTAELQKIPNLEVVYLDFTQISDKGLSHLAGLPKLQNLRLRGTKVTDRGLVHLERMPSLRELSLGQTTISDEGLKHVAGLTRLMWLALDNTSISDAGLDHLSGLKNLVQLNVNHTQISADGSARLKGSLPKVELLWSPVEKK